MLKRARLVGVIVVAFCVRFAPAESMKYGAVATVNPIATDAAMNTLKQGGNAVDAAVSAMLTLGVVDGHNSGIGGGCFMLVRMADGRVIAIDGRETAPARATRDMFLRDGKADTSLSQNGSLASGVPGSVLAYEYAVKQFGQKSFGDLLLPAADLAEHGFAINRSYERKLIATETQIRRFGETARILLNPDGSMLKEGDTLRQPDLADTYRQIAKNGSAWFYRGPFAQAVEDWMQANAGLLDANDFAQYEIKLRQPLVGQYRGHTVIGFPPPSSGGLHVQQILSMIERFDFASMPEADRITVTANAMQLAFADRAYWLGDPDFAPVPKNLLDSTYLAERSQEISPDRAIEVSHGVPPSPADVFKNESEHGEEAGKHTTHVSVVDAQGNVVSVTATVNTAFGSKVIIPGTGVIMNNQMDDFSVEPGVPNAFGLVGAEANAVGPRKRPLSSMSPAIIMKEDRPWIIIGAAGGPKIITQVVCVATQLIDLEQDPIRAMSSPRFHHQWKPASLWIERTFDAELREAMKRRGFTLDEANPSGATNLIVLDRDSAIPVSEPRLEGKASVE